MITAEPKKKIVVLIPCYNEEDGIGAVIQSFPREKLSANGFALEIIVIDNNSKDKTAEIAQSLGATVIHEEKKGKGNAMRRGFYAIPDDATYVVMLDGDNTYRPEEILRLVEPLDSGFCDVTIGSRLTGRIEAGSMKRTNRLGNWLFTQLVRSVYRVNVTDVLTGYFAWRRESLVRLRPHLLSQGFAIEMEMVTKMARLGESIYCVPISYMLRDGDTNLRPFYDGARILAMFMRNLFWRAPKPSVPRIAFVADSVMPYFMGGKEKRLYEISRRLAAHGNDVHIYTMHWWPEKQKTILHDGVTYHALCKLRPLYKNDKRSISEAICFAFATSRLLFERFDVLDVDHIPFFPLFSARVVTWLRGKKMYATWHEVWGKEYWFEYMNGLSGYFGYVVERLALRLPNIIISNSLHTTTRLREVGVKQQIHTIPLGADFDDIVNADPHREKSDVLFVGRLLKHKNADLLVEAMAIVKKQYADVRAIIVGDGPERIAIEDRIRTLQLEDTVRLFDRVEKHSELYGLMKSSKMLALPSVREGFGLVVVEAHAAGIPVITTLHKDNAAKELIEEGVNGFLVEPTAEDIAQSILRVLQQGKTMRVAQNESLYDWKNVVKKFEQALAR